MQASRSAATPVVTHAHARPNFRQIAFMHSLAPPTHFEHPFASCAEQLERKLSVTSCWLLPPPPLREPLTA